MPVLSSWRAVRGDDDGLDGKARDDLAPSGAEGQAVCDGALAASLSPTKIPMLATFAPGCTFADCGVAIASQVTTPTPLIRCADRGSTWIRATLCTPGTPSSSLSIPAEIVRTEFEPLHEC